MEVPSASYATVATQSEILMVAQEKVDSELTDILIVEDDPDIQCIIGIALKQVGGFQVQACSSGVEALEKLQSFVPQLVLLDVMMPGLDGPTTLAEMRQRPLLSKIPVIFLTAKALDQEIPEYRKQGVLGVIIKPFDPMTLSDTIRQLWHNHQG